MSTPARSMSRMATMSRHPGPRQQLGRTRQISRARTRGGAEPASPVDKPFGLVDSFPTTVEKGSAMAEG
jgi:hypothetical protein